MRVVIAKRLASVLGKIDHHTLGELLPSSLPLLALLSFPSTPHSWHLGASIHRVDMNP